MLIAAELPGAAAVSLRCRYFLAADVSHCHFVCYVFAYYADVF